MIALILQPLVNLSKVKRVENLSQDAMTEDHLFIAVPVIVTDAMTDWRAVKDVNFGVEYITEVYICYICSVIVCK